VSISTKCQYGVRALHELARRYGEGLVSIPVIADAQAIPERFLENILNQLRQGGFVESRRGKRGGFVLSRPPADITLDEVVRFIDGEIYELDCEGANPTNRCRLRGSCVFLPIWKEAKAAIEGVFANKTLQDIVDSERQAGSTDYCI
jgi:Rrf2 family protein